jgi:hypothetical protein
MLVFIGAILAKPVSPEPAELGALTQPRSLGTDDDKPKTRDGLEVWDTGQPSPKALATTDLDSKTGWKRIPPSEKHDSFQGDAVITNGRILAVLRRKSPAVEIYSASNLKVGREDSAHPTGAVRLRLQLLKSDKESSAQLEEISLVENAKGAVMLEASYLTANKEPITARFRIKRGEDLIQVEPGANAAKLNVECPSRYVVLPDFFADDIFIDARSVAPDSMELPSENFVLHLAAPSPLPLSPGGRGRGEGGEAIVMCAFENRQHDVKVALAGKGDERVVVGSVIDFEGKKIWVDLLKAPQVWHTLNLKAEDTGKTLPLEWKMPFPAQWRVDFTQANGLSDSWEMLLQADKGEGYVKPTWLGAGEDHLGTNRKRWNTVLGWYPYPCWSDLRGHGYLQPIESKALQFQGPVVIYPINRVKQTPLDVYTVVDVMRNTLGVGPCEYILDLEGQKAEYKGRATCSCRDELAAIYEKNRQKQERAKIDKILDDGLIFVKHIRGRITRYVEFGHKMREYLAEQQKAHPELSKVLDELDKIAGAIDARVAARADEIKTPAYVAAMNEDFRKKIRDDDGPNALANCKKYSEALVEIGGNQDELAGECRWVVKSLRQKAGMLLAQDPRLVDIAAEIRSRTQVALRNPANHEGAHH